MSLTTTTQTSGPYSAGAGATTFVYGFRVLESAHLRVYVNGTLQTTGYSVTGVENPLGGTVVFSTPLAGGEVIVLARDTDQLQETVYNEHEKFPAKTHEEALDKLTMLSQEIHRRALMVPINSPDAQNLIPLLASNPSLFLRVNPSGDGWVFSTVPTTVTAVSTTFLSVVNFGAVGDGITDDTAAINAAGAAAAALGHAGVYFPPGVYLLGTVTGTGSYATLLNHHDNVTWWAMPGSVVLKADPGLTAAGNWNFWRKQGAVVNSAWYGLTFDWNGNEMVVGNESLCAIGCDTTPSAASHDLRAEACTFLNNPGSQSIVIALNLATDPKPYNLYVLNNAFPNFGKAIGGNNTDHSAVYLQANRAFVIGNMFACASLTNTAAALEMHTTNSVIALNVTEGVDTGINIVALTSDFIGNRVEQNIFNNCYRGVYYWCAAGHVSQHNSLSHNTILLNAATSDGTAGSVTGGGIYPATVTGTQIDMDVTGNLVACLGTISGNGKSATGIYIANAKGWRVRGNTVSRVTGPGIFGYQTGTRTFQDISILGNSISDVGVGGVADSKVGVDLLAAGATMVDVRVRFNDIFNRDFATTLTGVRANGNVTILMVDDNYTSGTTPVDISAWTGTSGYFETLTPDSNGGTREFGNEFIAKVFHSSALGSAAAVAYGTTTGVNSGLYFPNNLSAALSANGNENLLVDETAVQVKYGGSGGLVPVCSHPYTDSVPAGNVGTGETALKAVVLIPDTFDRSTMSIESVVSGVFAANGNTKTLRFKFGGVEIVSYAGTDSGSVWEVIVRSYRTGTSAQRHHGKITVANNVVAHVYTTTTADETANITVSFTGQSNTASDDVTANDFDVEVNN